MYLYDAEEAQRRSVTDEDYSELRGIIETLTGLAAIARREGLLALEECIDEIEEPLLKLGILLMAEGNEASLVENCLLTALHAGEYKGVELVKRLIIVSGVMSIHEGENPSTLETLLSTYLGEEEALAQAKKG
jgi:flagellar motor component MotA